MTLSENLETLENKITEHMDSTHEKIAFSGSIPETFVTNIRLGLGFYGVYADSDPSRLRLTIRGTVNGWKTDCFIINYDAAEKSVSVWESHTNSERILEDRFSVPLRKMLDSMVTKSRHKYATVLRRTFKSLPEILNKYTDQYISITESMISAYE